MLPTKPMLPRLAFRSCKELSMFETFLIRCGWYKHRKNNGHPITMWRALFSDMPRFSAYEQHEAGCPDWALQAYNA